MNWIHRIPYRRALFVVFSLYVFASSAAEIVNEFADGEPLADMMDDVALLVVSALTLTIFGVDYLAQQRALSELRGQLDNARGQLSQLDNKAGIFASQYRQVMQKQFDTWQLTSSEQEVTLALLKGLSFREIAELRDTREKTVRQQATGVYKKSGVSGRHELAAWFFEDLLDPQAINREPVRE